MGASLARVVSSSLWTCVWLPIVILFLSCAPLAPVTGRLTNIKITIENIDTVGARVRCHVHQARGYCVRLPEITCLLGYGVVRFEDTTLDFEQRIVRVMMLTSHGCGVILFSTTA